MFTPGQVAVSTMALNNPPELVRLVTAAPELRLGVELFAEGPEWDDWERAVGLVRTLLRDHQGRRSLHAPFYDLNLASERYSSLRSLTKAVLERSVLAAAELDCGYLVVHPCSGTSYLFSRWATQRLVKEALGELAEKARSSGVRLAVENVGYGPTQLFDAGEFVRLVREIPHLYAVLDVGHAFVNRWDMPEVLVQLGDRLLALHLHDNHGQLDEHLPIGQGAIDFGLLWSVLETSLWQPTLVLETTAPRRRRCWRTPATSAAWRPKG